MAVNPTKLDRYTRQAIETWSSTQNHTKGFRVTDTSTGKTYRYVQLKSTTTTQSGTPLGQYNLAGASSVAFNDVTGDVTDSTCLYPLGIARGAGTDTNCYGWMEEKQTTMPTTVNIKGTIAVGNILCWAADTYLISTTNTGAGAGCAEALAVHTSTASGYIQWL